MNAKHVARTFEFLTIPLAVSLEGAMADLRAARKRGWNDSNGPMWLLWLAREQAVRRAAWTLRECYHAARSLGLQAEFLAVCRRCMASGRKGGAR
jgi:hypothetical protein